MEAGKTKHLERGKDTGFLMKNYNKAQMLKRSSWVLNKPLNRS